MKIETVTIEIAPIEGDYTASFEIPGSLNAVSTLLILRKKANEIQNQIFQKLDQEGYIAMGSSSRRKRMGELTIGEVEN